MVEKWELELPPGLVFSGIFLWVQIVSSQPAAVLKLAFRHTESTVNERQGNQFILIKFGFARYRIRLLRL
jgi:hypothetical protein